MMSKRLRGTRGKRAASFVDGSAYSAALTTQFSTTSRIKPLRAACADEGALMVSAVYEVTVPGKSAVFVHVANDGGGRGGHASTAFSVALENLSEWRCQ